MSVEDSEKGQPVGVRLGVVVRWGEIQLSRVSVLHADAPALHGGHAVDESVILALFGSLDHDEDGGVSHCESSREREREETDVMALDKMEKQGTSKERTSCTRRGPAWALTVMGRDLMPSWRQDSWQSRSKSCGRAGRTKATQAFS